MSKNEFQFDQTEASDSDVKSSIEPIESRYQSETNRKRNSVYIDAIGYSTIAIVIATTFGASGGIQLLALTPAIWALYRYGFLTSNE